LRLGRLGRGGGRRGDRDRRWRLPAEQPCIAAEREGQEHEDGGNDFGEIHHGRQVKEGAIRESLMNNSW
jgi:hypothetical protein